MLKALLGRESGVAAPEVKASATAGVVAFHNGGKPAWSPRDTPSLVRNGFLANPVAFRSVKLIAEAASAVPVLVAGTEGHFDTHPAKQLLARPNGTQAGVAFFEALFAQYLLSGNAYLEAVGGGDGQYPLELHVLRSDRMHVVPAQNGWPDAYEYRVGQKKRRFKVGDGPSGILHIRSFHPQDDHYGLSPMGAAATALDVHNAASRWSKALLDNAARPSGAIVYKGVDGVGSMGQDQYERLVDELEAHHQGARNAGRPMLLEGGLDWKPMGYSPSDMEFQETRAAAARDIALAFGVPPMLLGLPGDATYANYQEANRAFYRTTVLPLVTRVLSELSSWLQQFSGEALSLRIDQDAVPALAAERDAHWRRVADADFLTDAEKRRLLGLPARDAEEG